MGIESLPVDLEVTQDDVLGAGGVVPPMKTGEYYSALAGTGTTTPVEGELRCTPLFVGEDITLDRLAVEVTSAGEAGSLYRLGLYDDDGGGFPGALILDAGTVAGDSTGIKEITISQAVTAGWLWLAAVAQSCPTTPPTVRSVQGTRLWPLSGSASAVGLSNDRVAYVETGVTGALPDPFAGFVNASNTGQRLAVRTA